MLATEPTRIRIATRLGFLLGSLVIVAGPTISQAREDRSDDWPPESLEFFETRIRPVLAEHCLSCHGDRKQTSGLRLDSRAAILDGGFIEGPAVYLDEPAESPLLAVLRHDSELKMPPEEKLPEGVIGDLERWVGMGMPWPDDSTIPTPEDAADASRTHWAFQPIDHPTVPEVSDPSWVSTSVDAFILSRLDNEGLQPSEEADRRTLIRRVTYDLIGLPPSPEEVEAFLNDPRSDDEAFADLVDRLLANPHYGERWGRHWLDVARYADTKGYVFTEERRYPYAYTYRDYVVQSFNEDKPFDRFILEQLAADQLDLPEGDPALAGMGFLTVGQRFLNNTHDMIDDRIDVVSRGFMGLTIACARCHDHKYDPIPTADYYSLYGVFNSSIEPESLPLIRELVDSSGPVREEFLEQLRGLEGEVEDFLRSKRDEISSDFQKRLASYLDALQVIGPLDLDAEEGQPRRRRLEASFEKEARSRELQPRRLFTFLERWTGLLKQAESGGDPIFGPWHALAALPVEQFAEQAPECLDGFSNESGQPINPIIERALREPGPPATFDEVVTRYAEALSDRDETETDEEARAALNALFEPETGALAISLSETTGILERDERDTHRELERKVAALQVNHPGAPPRAMVLVDAEQPNEPVIFVRGNPGNQGPQVPRQFLQLLEGDDRQPFSQGSGRLELARKIADPSNPLTARVMVNRIWMQHFGRPIVGTPSDFGTRSDLPSHPELLDHLATRFLEEGWSIKEMHRLILNSRTYRQSSLPRSEAAAVDPENFLLWRQNRKRLELEPMRDAMLAVAGRLDTRFGGRPNPSPSDSGGTRRTLYSMIDRTFLDGVYRTFDFASTEVSNPDRPSTIVPQQALFLMNSPFVAEQARHLAERSIQGADSVDPEARINWLYQWLFGRSPDPSEVEIGRNFLETRHEVSEVPTTPWRYGFGGVDVEAGQVVNFQELPHWTGEAWQFGPDFPHSEGSYLQLRAGGGHVGPDQDRAAIRRWVAPDHAVVRIEGRLLHRSDEGDGVRARVVSESGGILGEWTASGNRARTIVERFEVAKGETIDFVVDCLDSPDHDSFEWAPTVQAEFLDGRQGNWNARSDFQGPRPEAPTPDQRYAQALLMTNEFIYID